MENKNYLIIGGSSGIGLEITKQLANQGQHIFVASRTSEKIPNSDNIHHIKFDVATEELPTDQLPESLDGLAYCPGTINLKPFRQLKKEDFEHDLKINFSGAKHSNCIWTIKEIIRHCFNCFIQYGCRSNRYALSCFYRQCQRCC